MTSVSRHTQSDARSWSVLARSQLGVEGLIGSRLSKMTSKGFQRLSLGLLASRVALSEALESFGC